MSNNHNGLYMMLMPQGSMQFCKFSRRPFTNLLKFSEEYAAANVKIGETVVPHSLMASIGSILKGTSLNSLILSFIQNRLPSGDIEAGCGAPAGCLPVELRSGCLANLAAARCRGD
jgi:hypothetical protein